VPTPLVDYYRELQRREGVQVAELIAEWDDTAIDEISNRLQSSIGTVANNTANCSYSSWQLKSVSRQSSRRFLHFAVSPFPNWAPDSGSSQKLRTAGV